MVMGEGELRIRKRSPFDETSYLGLPPDTNLKVNNYRMSKVLGHNSPRNCNTLMRRTTTWLIGVGLSSYLDGETMAQHLPRY